ncbi:SLOG family protein [Actinopolyspora halophila]|uniref:SLOG family protein n=1 Tax=Actinopolyspora halophila TaxID=1850 RepID=UPI00035F5D8D|nr:SLOG family protein [Actinopolyspora halophila]
MQNTVWTRVACTGHRPHLVPSGCWTWLYDEFVRIAGRLRTEYGTEVAASGGAAGSDLLWAAAAHEAGLYTEVYLPFPGHEARWPDSWQPWRERLHTVLDRADRVQTVASEPGENPAQRYHDRDRALVVDSHALVAAHDPTRSRGGTVVTMRHAWDNQRPLIRVDIRNQQSTRARTRP